ncbi:MAG: recombinase RecA [Phycisphaerae bacterium]|nr:recombinase RecA [Phycisphaerae bacterium]
MARSSTASAEGTSAATKNGTAATADPKADASSAGKSSGKADSAVEPKGSGKADTATDTTSKKNEAPVDPKAAERAKEKAQNLGRVVSQIEKSHGKGSIMRLDEDAYLAIPGISTGALSLDLALGGRGIPRGRIVEVFGPESSGKTTLALTVAAHAQKNGGVAAFIDAEHALDPSWARKIGVNIDDLLVSQPDTGEQALDICELLVRSNAVDIIVVDSVAALIPRAEIEGEMGDTHVGLQARLMSQAMRKLTGVIARSSATVIFINQIREKIGVMFGSPETTPGGRALKFYSSVCIDIRRTGSLKDGEEAVGNHVRAKVVKNKVAPPFRVAEFDIMFDEGISATGDLVDLAVDCNVCQKSGAWYSYGELRLGQGRERAKEFLRDNPDLFAEIRAKVLDIKAPKPKKAEAVEAE